MSCRLPESNNVEEFWNLLLEGRCAVRDIPEGRWTKEQNFTLNSENKMVQAGFMSAPVDEFDNKFFGMSPGLNS
jgi:acyl transferase domain-containing protein